MKSLYDYELLQNEVFYRSENILKYLERHGDISDLDKEAIANTILDALVTRGLIDPNTQSLDLSTLSIVDDLVHTRYDVTPNVTSIPFMYKQMMRKSCLLISGGVPISIFCAKPAGVVQTCIYDMNTAFSYLFSDFRFIECDYDSPTRPGVRATKRPFVEVAINGEEYLVDMLTKRIFKSSWFKEKYNLEVTFSRQKSTFDESQEKYYNEATRSNQNMAPYLSLMELMKDTVLKEPKQEETVYEINQSRNYFPEAFEEMEQMRRDMMMLYI